MLMMQVCLWGYSNTNLNLNLEPIADSNSYANCDRNTSINPNATLPDVSALLRRWNCCSVTAQFTAVSASRDSEGIISVVCILVLHCELAEWNINLSDVPGVLLDVGTEVGTVSHCKLLS